MAGGAQNDDAFDRDRFQKQNGDAVKNKTAVQPGDYNLLEDLRTPNVSNI